MNDYAQATDLLQEAGRSLSAQLTANVPLRNALQVVNTTYEQSQPLGVQSEEFRSAVNTVLTTGAMDYVGISVTPLTEGFNILCDQRTAPVWPRPLCDGGQSEQFPRGDYYPFRPGYRH